MVFKLGFAKPNSYGRRAAGRMTSKHLLVGHPLEGSSRSARPSDGHRSGVEMSQSWGASRSTILMGGEPLDNTWALRTQGTIRSIKHWVTLDHARMALQKLGQRWITLLQKKKLDNHYVILFVMALSSAAPIFVAPSARDPALPNALSSGWLLVSAAPT